MSEGKTFSCWPQAQLDALLHSRDSKAPMLFRKLEGWGVGGCVCVCVCVGYQLGLGVERNQSCYEDYLLVQTCQGKLFFRWWFQMFVVLLVFFNQWRHLSCTKRIYLQSKKWIFMNSPSCFSSIYISTRGLYICLGKVQVPQSLYHFVNQSALCSWFIDSC